MSIVERTLAAFPRGRTTSQLVRLLDIEFDADARKSLFSELSELLRAQRLEQRQNGAWHLHNPQIESARRHSAAPRKVDSIELDFDTDIYAVNAIYTQVQIDTSELVLSGSDLPPQPAEILRYYRATLRDDPRGRTTLNIEQHGINWHLICGAGPVAPAGEGVRRIEIATDTIPSSLREAMARREEQERSLAIGWPLAVLPVNGVPRVVPVALYAAHWSRADNKLCIDIDVHEPIVNPVFASALSRVTSWSTTDLDRILDVGTQPAAIDRLLDVLHEIASSMIRRKITGHALDATLSLSSDGIYDAAAIVLPTDSTFTAGSVRDLDTIAQWPQAAIAETALGAFLGMERTEREGVAALNAGPANPEQLAGLSAACNTPFSVVTGPPGTGKSEAIVSMVASVLLAGGSVMVASKNHQALDAVEGRLTAIAPNVPFAVRALDPAREIDTDFKDVLAELVADGPALQPPRNHEDWVAICNKARQRDMAIAAEDERRDLEFRLADIQDRLDAGLRREVEPTSEHHSFINRLLDFLLRRKHALAAPFVSTEAEMAALRADRLKIKDYGLSCELAGEVAKMVRAHLPQALAEQTAVSASVRAKLLQHYDVFRLEGGRARVDGTLARDILKHRPLWLASILGAPKRIPLTNGLFDLVIFDEASQADIASAIPLMARAKRMVVVGDDRQLSGIKGVSRAADVALMRANGLSVSQMGRFAQSNHSLFDAAVRVPNATHTLLTRQYRSAGPIVDYVSQEFYGGALQAHYDPSSLHAPNGQKPGLAWSDVPARLENGQVNRAEVEKIAAHVHDLLVNQNYEGSIGVISPFRAQVHALQLAVRAQVPALLLESSDLRIATVDGFQGQERDLILFSPTLGSGSTVAQRNFVAGDLRRLNVAISRARAVAHIFGDLNFAKTGKITALARLARRATEPSQRSGEGVFDSDWERRVDFALRARGLKPVPQYEIAGRRLDFALFAGDVKLDLEVDGRRWHLDQDGLRKSSDIWRDAQLKALGWRIRRFWVDELAENMENCIDLIERDLETHAL